MQAYEDEILAYKGTGRRYDTLRLCFETIYNDDIDSLTSDPAAMRRHHPRHADRVPKPDPTVRSVPPRESRFWAVIEYSSELDIKYGQTRVVSIVIVG